MPQTVKVAVTLTIKPTGLVINPNAVTLPDEVVGDIINKVPLAKVSGGTLPYKQPVLDPASPSALPPGLTASVDASGNLTISGTPTAPGTGTFILDVSDSGA